MSKSMIINKIMILLLVSFLIVISACHGINTEADVSDIITDFYEAHNDIEQIEIEKVRNNEI